MNLTYLLVVVTIKPCSAAGIFSKQIRCEKGTCSNVLVGLITLSNEEAFEYESFNVRDGTTAGPPLGDATGAVSGDTPGSGNTPTWGKEAGSDNSMVVNLKIEKSPLMVSYQLSYEKDVVGGITEDVFDYPWASAVGGGSHAFDDAPDFDPDRCKGKHNDALANDLTSVTSGATDPVIKSLLKGGRVCGCTDTGWGSSHYTGTQRSNLNCNAWPAVFRPSSTIWASRHCPRVTGPVYEAYSIRDWKWDYELKVTMNWTANDGQSKERIYLLDWSKQEAKDDELDFHFKIIFSLPKFGHQPPDLHATHYLIVPKNNTNENHDVGSELEKAWRQTSRRHKDMIVGRMTESERALDVKRQASLLVPKERVDLTGRSCDKVGVSLLTWAHEVHGVDYREQEWVGKPDFCGSKAGTCTHLQPNDLLLSDRQMVNENKPPNYLLEYQTLDGWSAVGPYLLSDRKLLQTKVTTNKAADKKSTAADRMASVIAWPTSQQHSTQLEISLNSTDIAWLPAVAAGDIDDMLVHIQKVGTVSQVLAVVRNKEDFDAKFTLSSPSCNLGQEAATDDAMQSSNSTASVISHLGDKDLAQNLSVGGSPLTLTANPVSKTLKGQKAEVMMLTLERLTGNSYAVYNCAISLLNSQGTVLTTRNVDVEFSSREALIGSLEKPLESPNNVTSYRVNPISMEAQPYDSRTSLVGAWLGGYNQSTAAIAGCNCELWNLWCYAANIVECTRIIRRVVMIGAGSLIAVVLTVFLMPCLVQCGAWFCRLAGRRMVQCRNMILKKKLSSSAVPTDITRREVTTVESSMYYYQTPRGRNSYCEPQSFSAELDTALRTNSAFRTERLNLDQSGRAADWRGMDSRQAAATADVCGGRHSSTQVRSRCSSKGGSQRRSDLHGVRPFSKAGGAAKVGTGGGHRIGTKGFVNVRSGTSAKPGPGTKPPGGRRAFFPSPSQPSSYVVSSRDVNEPRHEVDSYRPHHRGGEDISDSPVLEFYMSDRARPFHYASDNRRGQSSDYQYASEYCASEYPAACDELRGGRKDGIRRSLKDPRRHRVGMANDSSRPTTASVMRVRPATYDDRRRRELLDMIKRKRESYRDASLADDSSS